MDQGQDIVLVLGLASCVLALAVLLKFYLPKRSPFTVTWDLVREHAWSTQSLFYLLTLAGIICLDILETKYDASITQFLHWDFTSLFLRLEGSAGALFQVVHFPLLTYGLSVLYLYVFPVMGIAAVMACAAEGRGDISRKIFWAAVFNYVLILPFYLLVPVSERWGAGDGQVLLLMNEISPLLIQGLRPLSGLNNCFPSFHCSLALTFALITSASPNKRLRRTTLTLALLIVFSTLYLGFHWVLDVFAGALFAAGCSLLATWAVERYPMELALFRAR
jgi:membrane-associated phospholipid phosphatase